MAVSKKQPAKKRQKKKSSLWIISLIAVILLILVGVVFLVLPKFRKEAAPEKPETIKVEAAEKSYAAGSRLSEKNFRVYGISGKQKQLLDADTYSVSPAKVPAHGHSVTVEVSSKAYPDIKAEITVLIDRDESVRYKIGRENPDDVEAVLYSNGDLEITGKGSVRNFKSDSAPWKKDSVQRLTWIDPEAEVESMDYWFTGNDEYLETLCRIPDTVRSMVETFKNATAMTSMPDMSGAVRLEDITSCAEGCTALEKAMELPGNIKQAKKSFLRGSGVDGWSGYTGRKEVGEHGFYVLRLCGPGICPDSGQCEGTLEYLQWLRQPERSAYPISCTENEQQFFRMYRTGIHNR